MTWNLVQLTIDDVRNKDINDLVALQNAVDEGKAEVSITGVSRQELQDLCRDNLYGTVGLGALQAQSALDLAVMMKRDLPHVMENLEERLEPPTMNISVEEAFRMKEHEWAQLHMDEKQGKMKIALDVARDTLVDFWKETPFGTVNQKPDDHTDFGLLRWIRWEGTKETLKELWNRARLHNDSQPSATADIAMSQQEPEEEHRLAL